MCDELGTGAGGPHVDSERGEGSLVSECSSSCWPSARDHAELPDAGGARSLRCHQGRSGPRIKVPAEFSLGSSPRVCQAPVEGLSLAHPQHTSRRQPGCLLRVSLSQAPAGEVGRPWALHSLLPYHRQHLSHQGPRPHSARTPRKRTCQHHPRAGVRVASQGGPPRDDCPGPTTQAHFPRDALLASGTLSRRVSRKPCLTSRS